MNSSSWVRQNTEESNFYYPLTEMNRQDLISTVAVVTGRPLSEIRKYLEELLKDENSRIICVYICTQEWRQETL
jgi:hypothetical protein